MQVHDAQRVLARGVHGGVDGEARGIDEVGRVHDDLAVEVDFHERRGRHLLEEHAVGIDQEVVLGPGHAHGDVGEDGVVPPVQRHQAVERRQLHPRLPLAFGHAPLDGGGERQRSIGHGGLSCAVERLRSRRRPPASSAALFVEPAKRP